MKLISRVVLVCLGIVAFTRPASATSVTLQPIRVCNDAGASCANSANTLFEAEGDKIWAQAGIDLIFNPFLQINHTAYLSLANATTDPLTGEALALLDAATALHDSVATLAINLIFVQDFTGEPGLFGFGCGGPLFRRNCPQRTGIPAGYHPLPLKGTPGGTGT